MRRFGGTLQHHWVSFVELRFLPFITGGLGVPHATSNADIYDNYFIPQGVIPIHITAAFR